MKIKAAKKKLKFEESYTMSVLRSRLTKAQLDKFSRTAMSALMTCAVNDYDDKQTDNVLTGFAMGFLAATSKVKPQTSTRAN